MGLRDFDLWKKEDRVEFEKLITDLSSKYDGMFCPQGEKPDIDGMIKEW
jgi:hypothetical protein